MSTNGNDDSPDQPEEKTATVIQWPGARVPAPTPEAPPEPATPTADTLELADPAAIDAFEAAVRRAVNEKLAPQPGDPSQPKSAEDLVAKVYSALSGKDPQTALTEVREQIAARVAALQEQGGAGADVIDLAAAREARKQAASDGSQKITGAIRDTFNEFMAGISALNGHRSQIVLDAQFFKEHGPSLLGSLFQGLAGALLKNQKPAAATPTPAPVESDLTLTPDPTLAPDPALTPEPTTPPKEPVQVNVRVDFASILSGLFNRRQPAPRAPEEPPKGDT